MRPNLTDPTIRPRLEQLLTSQWGSRALDAPWLNQLATIALVHAAWRNTPLEDWHASQHPGSPTDYDMFRANVRLTQQALPHMTGRAPDTDALRDLFTDPGRAALPERTAAEFCGPEWELVQVHAHAAIDTFGQLLHEGGITHTLVLYAGRTLMSGGSNWWGTPGYETKLRTALRTEFPDLDADLVERWVGDPSQMPEDHHRRIRFNL